MTRAVLTAAVAVALVATPAYAKDVDSWARSHKPRITRHVVKRGETLTQIAQKLTVKGGPYRLAWVNRDRIEHPDLIEVGDVLVVPRKDGRRWVPRPPVKASRSWTETQQVGSSDSAWEPPQASSPAGHSSSSDIWSQLAACESGNTNARTGNGYTGYFQFSGTTFRSLGYSGEAADHSYAVQLEAAKRLQARSGWGQWPACSEKLGLR